MQSDGTKWMGSLPEAAVNAGDTVTGWPGVTSVRLLYYRLHCRGWRQGLVEVTMLDTWWRHIRWRWQRRHLLVTHWTGLSPSVVHVTCYRKLTRGHCPDVFRSGSCDLRSGKAGV